MLRATSLAAASLAVLTSCAGPADPALGPMSYDASGTLPCSAGSSSYDSACGYRVVRDDAGDAEIWISNIAVSDRAAYRVLTFSQGEFVATDGTALDVARSGDDWLVSVPGAEFYRIPGSAITG